MVGEVQGLWRRKLFCLDMFEMPIRQQTLDAEQAARHISLGEVSGLVT